MGGRGGRGGEREEGGEGGGREPASPIKRTDRQADRQTNIRQPGNSNAKKAREYGLLKKK